MGFYWRLNYSKVVTRAVLCNKFYCCHIVTISLLILAGQTLNFKQNCCKFAPLSAAVFHIWANLF